LNPKAGNGPHTNIINNANSRHGEVSTTCRAKHLHQKHPPGRLWRVAESTAPIAEAGRAHPYEQGL
jgi:hypothetical protein